MQIFATSSQVSRVIMLTFQESAIVSREKRKGVMKKRTCIMCKLPRNRAHFIFWAKNSKTIELDVITPQNAAAIAHHYAFLWLYTTRVPRVLIVCVCSMQVCFLKTSESDCVVFTVQTANSATVGGWLLPSRPKSLSLTSAWRSSRITWWWL